MAPPSIPNRYAEVHKDPQGPGDKRPTTLQILHDNDLIGKLTDKTILVTGGTDGLGLESVRQLAKTGAHVWFSARNASKAEGVVKELKQDPELTNTRIDWIHMDNNSLTSVRAGAEDFLRRSKQLNVLITNAGIGNNPRGVTEDGYEIHFGVNHLAHFLLFQLLKPLLLSSSTPSFHSRVVSVSSTAHGFSTVQLGNLNLTTLPTSGFDPLIEIKDVEYNPLIAYGQSKTANIWFANEIERRYGHTHGLHAISIHPGVIFTAGYATMDPVVAQKMEMFLQDPRMQLWIKNVAQGSATQVLAAVGKDYEGKGGFFMDDCSVARPMGDDEQIGFDGYRPWAYDEKGEKRLWRESLEMVGVKEEK